MEGINVIVRMKASRDPLSFYLQKRRTTIKEAKSTGNKMKEPKTSEKIVCGKKWRSRSSRRDWPLKGSIENSPPLSNHAKSQSSE